LEWKSIEFTVCYCPYQMMCADFGSLIFRVLKMICRPTVLEIKGMRGSSVFDYTMKCMAYIYYCCAVIIY